MYYKIICPDKSQIVGIEYICNFIDNYFFVFNSIKTDKNIKNIKNIEIYEVDKVSERFIDKNFIGTISYKGYISLILKFINLNINNFKIGSLTLSRINSYLDEIRNWIDNDIFGLDFDNFLKLKIAIYIQPENYGINDIGVNDMMRAIQSIIEFILGKEVSFHVSHCLIASIVNCGETGFIERRILKIEEYSHFILDSIKNAEMLFYL